MTRRLLRHPNAAAFALGALAGIPAGWAAWRAWWREPRRREENR